jgi:hypothetical protein
LTTNAIEPRAHLKGRIGEAGASMLARLWDATRLRLRSRGSRMVVPLDRLLIGHQGGHPLERWVRRTGEWSRVSCALVDSPYVRFLQEADEAKLRDDSWSMSTAYFHMAKTCIAATGHFKGAVDSGGILARMRDYYAGHASVSATPDASSGRVGLGAPVRVWRIEHADCFEIIDGHHRLASAYVHGEHTSEATVHSAKLTYLQKLLLDVNQASGRELYQPVPTLDVESWRVVRGCDDRLAMMTRFLDGEGRTSGTVLDLACSYGWFVKRFQDAG